MLLVNFAIVNDCSCRWLLDQAHTSSVSHRCLIGSLLDDEELGADLGLLNLCFRYIWRGRVSFQILCSIMEVTIVHCSSSSAVFVV